MTNSLL